MKKNKYVFDKERLMAEHEIVFVPVAKIVQQTPDEYLLRFEVSIRHDPGQFMQCSILGIGEAPISICSYSENFFEISVRAVGNVTNKICDLKKGDMLGLRGPYGHGYDMSVWHGKNVILVGGGCGVAPLRGIVEYLDQNRNKFGKITKYFGFRTSKDMLFPEDFERWQRCSMSLSLALSGEAGHPTAYKGFVTDLVSVSPGEGIHTISAVCGPPIMMQAAAKKLIEQGVPPSQIYVSEERQMKCGVGRCGHCMIRGRYCCKDGPVFRYVTLTSEK